MCSFLVFLGTSSSSSAHNKRRQKRYVTIIIVFVYVRQKRLNNTIYSHSFATADTRRERAQHIQHTAYSLLSLLCYLLYSFNVCCFYEPNVRVCVCVARECMIKWCAVNGKRARSLRDRVWTWRREQCGRASF